MFEFGFEGTPAFVGTFAQMKREIPSLRPGSATPYTSTTYPPASLHELCTKFRKHFGEFLAVHDDNPESERLNSNAFRFPKLSKVDLKVDASILAFRDEVDHLFQKTLRLLRVGGADNPQSRRVDGLYRRWKESFRSHPLVARALPRVALQDSTSGTVDSAMETASVKSFFEKPLHTVTAAPHPLLTAQTTQMQEARRSAWSRTLLHPCLLALTSGLEQAFHMPRASSAAARRQTSVIRSHST